jgi:pantothenate kinase
VDDAGMAELLRRARELTRPGQRRLLGIVGAPGSGKSTLARHVVDALGAAAQNVPMDGFHLASSELDRLGRLQRKGAPDTFDADGYVALLQRLRSRPTADVYAPEYRREVEESIGGAIRVSADTSLVVTEGNYLLLDEGGWAPVRELLDEIWFVEQPEDVRIEQLVARHIRFGKSPEHAREWSTTTDQRNADLVASTRPRADVVVRLEGGCVEVDTSPRPGYGRSPER